jgi:hypothetical protein
MAIQIIKLGELVSAVVSKINANFAEISTAISNIPTKLSQLENDANYVKTTDTAFTNKVDSVAGKGLSTNDYTDAEKSKLAGLTAPAKINFTASDFTTSGTQHTYTAALNGATPVCVMRDGSVCFVDMAISGSNVVITADETFAGYIVTV